MNKDSRKNQFTSTTNKNSDTDYISNKKINDKLTEIIDDVKSINQEITKAKNRSDNSPKTKIIGILEKFITTQSNNKKLKKSDTKDTNKNHSLKEQYNTKKGKLMSHDENKILNETCDTIDTYEDFKIANSEETATDADNVIEINEVNKNKLDEANEVGEDANVTNLTKSDMIDGEEKLYERLNNDTNEEFLEHKNEEQDKYKDLFGQSITLKFRDEDLTIYFNGLAVQSNASVLITYKLISVLCTLDLSDSSDEYVDFTQLTVHFLTKSYAFSRIPNGILKRENKSSERDILLSRLIDRSIRPIIGKNFQQPMQLICTLLSHHTTTTQTDLDVELLSVLGSIAAFQLSSIPLIKMPICARIGMKNDKFIFCPYSQELQKSPLDLFLSFVGDEVIMIECEAKNLPKETLVNAVAFARKEKIVLENFLLSLSEFAKPKIEIEPESKKLSRIIKVRYNKDIRNLLEISDKTERNSQFSKLEKKVINELTDDDLFLSRNDISKNFFDIKKKAMRDKIFETGIRIDGRKVDVLRDVSSTMNVPFMTSSHGSALFSRGKTKALVSVILGTTYDEQIVEGFESDRKERFILHYNFPPYATGEASQIKTPSRREVGHAKLAFKALKNFMPEKHVFPYTIRVSSEILSCDGSSSMATICGAALAMIDAGVPLKNCVAGIAIGVVTKHETNELILLSDLIGDEDHLGDMDFKVAGTLDGITALQMDVKNFGIKDDSTLEQILERGTLALKDILANMNAEIEAQKETIKIHAPLISQISVDKNQAKLIIGNRGDTIKTISEMSGARIDVDSSNNVVSIFANNRNAINKARDIIEDLILQAEVGKIYDGVVEKITDFGIFVKFLNDKMRGLIHEKNCENDIYEFYNLKKSLKIGDTLKVKVMFISSDGKIGLTIVPSNKKNNEEKNENGGNNSENNNNSSNSSENHSSNNKNHKSSSYKNSEQEIQQESIKVIDELEDNIKQEAQTDIETDIENSILNNLSNHKAHNNHDNQRHNKRKNYNNTGSENNKERNSQNFSEQQSEDDFLNVLNKNVEIDEDQSKSTHRNEKERNLNAIIEEKKEIIEEKKDPKYHCVFF